MSPFRSACSVFTNSEMFLFLAVTTSGLLVYSGLLRSWQRRSYTHSRPSSKEEFDPALALASKRIEKRYPLVPLLGFTELPVVKLAFPHNGHGAQEEEGWRPQVEGKYSVRMPCLLSYAVLGTPRYSLPLPAEYS